MALTKKLTKIGNSKGVILSNEILKMADMEDQEEVEIVTKPHEIIIKPTHMKDHKVRKAFMKVLEDFDETFKKLAS